MNVRLPNGTVIENIPDGTSKAEIQQRAIAAGLANPDDFGEASVFQQATRAVTGEANQTDQTRGLPEFDMPFEWSKRQAKTALGMMTTFDDKDRMKVLATNYPDLTFSEDEKGNIIVDGSAYGAEKGVLNAPGVSLRDLAAVGFNVAAFTPAGRLAKGGVLASSAKVGAGSAATQAGIDVAGQAAGRTQDVAVGNIKGADVLAAAAGGAGAELVFRALGRVLPMVKERIRTQGLTKELRSELEQVARRLGISLKDYSDDALRKIANEIDDSVAPAQRLAIADELEFDIPLTRGQRSLDDAQLSFEDRARAGMFGDRSQRTMRQFELGQQEPAIQAAKQRIAGEMGGEIIDAPGRAGATLGQAVREADDAAYAAVREAYDAIGDTTLNAEGMTGLLRATRRALNSVEFDKKLPQTASILGEISSAQRQLARLEKAGARIKPADWQRIEVMRRRINAARQAADNNVDRRQVGIVLDAFDGQIDKAVANGLFSGDVEGIKAARAVMSRYGSLYRENARRTASGRRIPDKAGELIQNIIYANPTDEQVVRGLFGASGVNNQFGAGIAKRLKKIVGSDSEAWGQVKQAAFLRLLKTNMVNGREVISGQQTVKAINKAINENPEVMRQLFNAGEIKTMRRFAAHVQRTQPQLLKSRENPSGTAQALVKTGRDILSRLGFLTGEPLAMTAAAGAGGATGLRQAAKARAATKPFAYLQQTRPELIGLSATGAVSTNE